jgi:hypothetical protein
MLPISLGEEMSVRPIDIERNLGGINRLQIKGIAALHYLCIQVIA